MKHQPWLLLCHSESVLSTLQVFRQVPPAIQCIPQLPFCLVEARRPRPVHQSERPFHETGVGNPVRKTHITLDHDPLLELIANIENQSVDEPCVK